MNLLTLYNINPDKKNKKIKLFEKITVKKISDFWLENNSNADTNYRKKRIFLGVILKW